METACVNVCDGVPKLTPCEVMGNDVENRASFAEAKALFLKVCLDHYLRAHNTLDATPCATLEANAWKVVQAQRRAALHQSFELACRAVHGLELNLSESADMSLFMSRI